MEALMRTEPKTADGKGEKKDDSVRVPRDVREFFWVHPRTPLGASAASDDREDSLSASLVKLLLCVSADH